MTLIFLSDALSMACLKANKYETRFSIEVVKRPAGNYGYVVSTARVDSSPIYYVEPGNVIVEVVK